MKKRTAKIFLKSVTLILSAVICTQPDKS